MIKFNVSFQITKEDFELLDNIIEESFAIYTTVNSYLLIQRDEPGYTHIPDEQIDKIVNNVCELVLRRISPVFLQRLSMVIASTALDEWIYHKVKLVVIDFVIKHNS